MGWNRVEQNQTNDVNRGFQPKSRKYGKKETSTAKRDTYMDHEFS